MLLAVFLSVNSSNGAAALLSSSKSYANYPSHSSPGQKRSNATLNLLNSHFLQPPLASVGLRCGFAVSRATFQFQQPRSYMVDVEAHVPFLGLIPDLPVFTLVKPAYSASLALPLAGHEFA
jgi:hypothetical protein